MRKRDKLYYKNKHQPSSEKSRKLKSLKHLIQSQSRKAYWDYVEDLISPKKENSPDENFSISKKFYTFIKHMKTDSTGIKTLKKNGSTITDPEQKADLLNNHFFSVFSQQIPMKLSALCKYFTNLFPNHENDMPEIQVTEKGVLKLLQALNISKAAGPDGIRPKVLKELSSELAPIFTLLFQASLHQQSIPNIWKHANVTPIYKKGDKTNPSNYRPVSLTCISCKLLERIICSNLMQNLTKHNILYPLQHGFRDKRSCESQLIEFVNDIAFNMQKGHQNDVGVMDFAKACDKVAHNRLLYKLSSYGVKGNTLGWIGSCLSGRSQKVVLEGKSSSSAQCFQASHRAQFWALYSFSFTSMTFQNTSLTALYGSLQMIPFLFNNSQLFRLHQTPGWPQQLTKMGIRLANVFPPREMWGHPHNHKEIPYHTQVYTPWPYSSFSAPNQIPWRSNLSRP